jgi:hypothetical protein
MSEDKDVLSDDAWDDVPGAEPKPSDSTKPAEAAKPLSEPPKPASTPPRPASSSPPKPASNPPRPEGSSSSISAQPTGAGSNPPRETSTTKPEGVAAVRGGTLIGIPAPSVVEPQGKPAEKSSDKPPERASDKPLHTASVVPAGKRTLIGIAAPVIDQKADARTVVPARETSTKEPAKAEAPSGSKPPPADPAPAAPSAEPEKPDKASLVDTKRERKSPAPTEEEYKISRAKSALAATRKETPDALSAARREARAQKGSKGSDAPEKSSRLGPILLLLVAGVAAAWFVFAKQRGGDEAVNEPAANPPAEVAQPAPEKPTEAPTPPPVATLPEPLPTPAASVAAAAPQASGVASAEPIPTVSADDLPAEPKKGKEKEAAKAKATAQEKEPAAVKGADTAIDKTPSIEGARVVIVKLAPADARLFYKGKSVGKSPVRVELAPGEKKRSFEVGAPGFVTRRLVVDGSQPEMWIGLRPESPTE